MFSLARALEFFSRKRPKNSRRLNFPAVAAVLIFCLSSLMVRAQTPLTESDPAHLSALTMTAPTLFKGLPSTFTIPLTTGDITSVGIVAYQFNILYDPAVIDPFGANFGCSTAGTISGAAGLSATCNVLPDGTLRVSVSGAGTISGGGALLNLTFKTDDFAVSGSSSPLDFRDAFFFNGSGIVTHTTVNGRITVVGPTAANASVAGKILTRDGKPLPNAALTLTDQNGFSRRARSNQLGFYRFTDIPVGAAYVIGASAKRFTFTPRVFNLVDDLTDFNLVAEPPEIL